MLADALVERYSRQILLPEVGGRGQERLCHARVVVVGDDDAGEAASDLLRAAGVDVVGSPAPRGTVAVDVDTGHHVAARWHAEAAIVVGLAGRPCSRCLPGGALALPARRRADTHEAPVAAATGALVATEVLRGLLGIARAGRRHVLDLGSDTFRGTPLSGPGCTACGGTV